MVNKKICLQKISKASSGQSALEFLVTYAWAFIVIAIVIAAIAYFGVLRPQKILPDRCSFTVSFDCIGYSLSTDGTFKVKLKNNVGTTITVNSLELSTDAGEDIGCTLTNVPVPPAPPIANWGLGGVQDLEWAGCDLESQGFAAGDKAKLIVNMTYYESRAGPTYTKLAYGDVFVTVT